MNEQQGALLATALPEGVVDHQAAEPDTLRAKIQQGILGLQEGLLERGTEVQHKPLVPFVVSVLTVLRLTLGWTGEAAATCCTGRRTSTALGSPWNSQIGTEPAAKQADRGKIL